MPHQGHNIKNIDIERRLGDCSICKKRVRLRRRFIPKRNYVSWTCMSVYLTAYYRHRNKKKYGVAYAKEVLTKPLNCSLCGEEKPLCYDHDHTTGKFRGWLCHNCNLMLGHSRNNTKLLRKAIKYLEKK